MASVITSDTVTLNITTTASSFLSEKRFNKNITISELKMKLELISGCNAGTMKIKLFSSDDKFISELTDDSALLGSLHIDSGMRIHVSDHTVRQGEFDDVSKVQKYELTEDEYAQKKDSVRAFLAKNKLGHFKEVTPEEKAEKEAQIRHKLETEKTAFDRLSVGDRCSVQVPNQPARLGCIKYLGETSFKDGLWVGVHYDEPVGKNDGSVDGKRYFTCPLRYGGFLKPTFVTAGDFPPDDLGLDDEM